MDSALPPLRSRRGTEPRLRYAPWMSNSSGCFGGESTYPTPKWRDPDAARDPHLLVTTASVVEHPEGHAHHCWATWLKGVNQTLGMIAQCLDREGEEAFLGGTRDGEGVSLPRSTPTEAHEDKLPCYKRHGLGDRSEDDLYCFLVQSVDSLNGVVVSPHPSEERVE